VRSRLFLQSLPDSDHLAEVLSMVAVREVQPGYVHSLLNQTSRIGGVLRLRPGSPLIYPMVQMVLVRFVALGD
jgi:hypothetical protein